MDVQAESPEAFVKSHSSWPILDTGKNLDGEPVITTGDGHGVIVRYTFSE